jgi:hypothetical protein
MVRSPAVAVTESIAGRTKSEAIVTSHTEQITIPRETWDNLQGSLERLLKRVMVNACQHEQTHRGGIIWEICDDCGAQWADDRGGRPVWQDPPEWVDAMAALQAAKEVSERPLTRLQQAEADMEQALLDGVNVHGAMAALVAAQTEPEQDEQQVLYDSHALFAIQDEQQALDHSHALFAILQRVGTEGATVGDVLTILDAVKQPRGAFASAYWKACESAQPIDWMQAALAAQRLLQTSKPTDHEPTTTQP